MVPETDKTIVVQTINGQVYIHPDFQIENNVPINGMIRITDNYDKTTYWFNIDNVIWIGPR